MVSWELVLNYAATYFVVATTILGTGILALPLKLVETGFTPLLVTYTLTVVMQAIVIVYMVELMVRVRALNRLRDCEDIVREVETSDMGDFSWVKEEEGKSSSSEEDRGDAEGSAAMDLADTEESVTADRVRVQQGVQQIGIVSPFSMTEPRTSGVRGLASLDVGPDLHSIGQLYLGPLNRIVFEFAVFAHFLSILVSYSLAGSTSYSNLLNLSFGYTVDTFHFRPSWFVIPFCVVWTCVIVFASRIIQQIITVLTMGKGTLLVVLVFITGIVAFKANVPISENWVYVVDPLLVGTVALGGAINTMPIVFAKMPFERKHMIGFAVTSVASLFTVYALNLIWCYFVLRVVPQKGPYPSLATAGTISTVPLNDIIETQFPSYKILAVIIALFIVVSISVSYITVGAGMKHYLDGVIKAWSAPVNEDVDAMDHISVYTRQFLKVIHRLMALPSSTKQVLLYGCAYSIVCITALLDPHGFLSMIEYVTSLALNVEAGWLVPIMLAASRAMVTSHGHPAVPWCVPLWLFHARWAVMFFFVFAVAYSLLDVSHIVPLIFG